MVYRFHSNPYGLRRGTEFKHFRTACRSSVAGYFFLNRIEALSEDTRAPLLYAFLLFCYSFRIRLDQ